LIGLLERTDTSDRLHCQRVSSRPGTTIPIPTAPLRRSEGDATAPCQERALALRSSLQAMPSTSKRFTSSGADHGGTRTPESAPPPSPPKVQSGSPSVFGSLKKSFRFPWFHQGLLKDSPGFRRCMQALPVAFRSSQTFVSGFPGHSASRLRNHAPSYTIRILNAFGFSDCLTVISQSFGQNPTSQKTLDCFHIL
jgi:hypothetical protein